MWCFYEQCQFQNCGWSFKTKYKLERHQSRHSAVKKFIVSIVVSLNMIFRRLIMLASIMANSYCIDAKGWLSNYICIG